MSRRHSCRLRSHAAPAELQQSAVKEMQSAVKEDSGSTSNGRLLVTSGSGRGQLGSVRGTLGANSGSIRVLYNPHIASTKPCARCFDIDQPCCLVAIDDRVITVQRDTRELQSNIPVATDLLYTMRFRFYHYNVIIISNNR